MKTSDPWMYVIYNMSHSDFWKFVGPYEGGNARNFINPYTEYITVYQAMIKHKEVVQKYNNELR